MSRSFSKSSSVGISSLPELKAIPLLNADSQYADEYQETTKLAGQATIEFKMEMTNIYHLSIVMPKLN